MTQSELISDDKNGSRTFIMHGGPLMEGQLQIEFESNEMCLTIDLDSHQARTLAEAIIRHAKLSDEYKPNMN